LGEYFLPMKIKTIRYIGLPHLDRQLCILAPEVAARNEFEIRRAKAFAQEKLDNDPAYSNACAFLLLK
jgi:hypothetical protein